MSDKVKLSPEIVEGALTKMKQLIATSEDDLKAFESIASTIVTEENVKASKNLRKLADVHETLKNERKQTIKDAMENLKLAVKKLTEYKEAFGM